MTLESMTDAAIAKISGLASRSDDDVSAKREVLIERTRRLIDAVGEGGGIQDGWLSVADADTVGFSPATQDGQPILINGKSTTFWARSDLSSALRDFREALAAGAFDDQFRSGGQPTVSPKIEGEQTPADPDNGAMSTGGGRTDTDETETRFTENLDNRLLDRP